MPKKESIISKSDSGSGIAVVNTGGKQYVVSVGMELEIEKINTKIGNSITLPDILNDKKVKITILENIKGPKISILKFKNKTRYLRRMGHRQKYTLVRVESIV